MVIMTYPSSGTIPIDVEDNLEILGKKLDKVTFQKS